MAPKGHSLYVKHVGPTTLDYERALTKGRLGAGKDIFNDLGFVIRGKAESGEDVHLWMFIYETKGPEVIIDGDLTQTLMVYGKFSDEDKKSIRDAPYINKGQNIDDYEKPGSMKIEESSDKVIWSNAGRTMECTPPLWKIGGTHAGVKVDLSFKQTSDAFFHCGTFESLAPDSGMAGYVLHGRASGTIEVDGKVLKMVNAHGVHERIFMSNTVPRRVDYMGGRGEQWVHGFGEEFSWYMLTADVSGSSTAMVNIDGKLHTVTGKKDAWTHEIGYWHDPKTNQTNPHKWESFIITDVGRLDATVTAYKRGFYTWIRRGGTLVVHQYVADCKATFTKTDGTVIESNQVASFEYMRTLYKQEIE